MEEDGKWKKKQRTNLQLQEALASERFKKNSTDQVKALRDTQIDIAETQRAQKK